MVSKKIEYFLLGKLRLIFGKGFEVICGEGAGLGASVGKLVVRCKLWSKEFFAFFLDGSSFSVIDDDNLFLLSSAFFDTVSFENGEKN